MLDMKEEPKRRGKYGRPCDRCASRRVRCMPLPNSKRCVGCTNMNIECTHNRVRHKSGPKLRKREPEIKRESPQNMVLPLLQPMAPVVDGYPATMDSGAMKILADLDLGQAEIDDTVVAAATAEAALSFSVPLVPLAASVVGDGVPNVLAIPAVSNGGIPNLRGVPTATANTGPVAPETGDIFEAFLTAPVHLSKFSVDHLLPRLQVYQTWFYGSWPVLSVAELILTILDGAQMRYEKNTIRLTEQNAMLYALCCSVCAAITTQISFVSDKDTVLDYNTFSASEYADEARRVRNLFDFSAAPNVQTLLSSFFLYAHYVNNKGRTLQAIIYLREAITIAQLLGFHEEISYEGKTRAEIHRWRKIYYTLLITERFMCFEDGMPVVLEPCIAFPNLDDEEYPSLLVGFTELIRVFSVPTKEFFAEIGLKSNKQAHGEAPTTEKKERILLVQQKLWNITLGIKKIANSQKLDVLLSRSWLRALAWHLTSENGLVMATGNADNCFDLEFPVTIAKDFLAQTKDLPMFAFEANGPGVCLKLLEIATSVTQTIQKENPSTFSLSVLESLFQIITKCENDVTLPLDTYQKIGNVISYFKTKTIPRLMHPTEQYRGPYIEELIDDVDVDGEEAKGDDNDCVRFTPQTVVGTETPMYKSFHLNAGYDGIGGVSLGATPSMDFRENLDQYNQAMAEMRRSGKISTASSSVSLNNMMNMIMTQTPQGQDKCGGALEEFLAGFTGKSGNCMTSET